MSAAKKPTLGELAREAYAAALKANASPLTAAEAWARADQLHAALVVARDDEDRAGAEFRRAYEVAKTMGPRPVKAAS